MTAVLTLSVILFGILSYLQLPVNDLPAVDYPVIQVQVGYPGASPDTIANNIATPLERQFMQINGLEVVTSQSTQGFATFTLQFALDKNIDAAATDVQTAISQAQGSLPADLPSPPTYSKTNPNDQPIMYIALTSDSVTPGQLYDYASTQVGQRLSILPGVSRVNVFGTKSAIRIKANPDSMWARGISIDDLTAAIKAGSSYTGAGQLDSSSGTSVLRPQGQLETADQYSNLIIGGSGTSPIYLRDVAEVKDSVQDERINMKFWVRGYNVPSATVIVAVNRRAGANAVEVARSIRELLADGQRATAGFDQDHAHLRSLFEHRALSCRCPDDSGHRLRARGDGDLRLSGSSHRHAHPGCCLALVAPDHVHGDARAGIQSRQFVAHGFDPGHRFPGRRCDRLSGKHCAANGAR
jgi:HAE1 family hydrophobic/amphiphilic exporter-1